MKVCSIEGCGRNVIGRGFCSLHYQRLIRHGDPLWQKQIVTKICTIDGCDGKQDAKGYCHSHYNRYKRHGDPLGGSSTFDGDTHKWLLDNLDYTGDDCLLWPYARDSYGYGNIRIDGKTERVHLVVATIKYGPRPPGYDTTHSCGQGHLGCVNHKHLSYKTRKENCDDALKHGTRPMGEKHYNSVLTEFDVLSIIKDTRTYHVISADYDVSGATIGDIKRGKSWSWLTGIKP